MHLEGAGYHVDIAADGFAALEACEKKEYKLILMDVQMPGIDGYETTQRLRERGGWLKDVAILGVTANADDKTFKECFAVGMNGVMTKPIRRESFLAEVARWIGAVRQGVSAAAEKVVVAEAPAPLVIMDYNEAIREFGGNKTLLDGVVQRFLKQVNQQVPMFDAALKAHDAAAIAREAHKIKGAAANLTATKFAAKAKEIELKGKAGSLDGMDVLIEELKKELADLMNFVKNGYRHLG